MIHSSQKRSEIALALLLIFVGVFFRVVPHFQNFTPVTAIAFFSGVVLSPALAFTLPLIIMIASDLIVGPHGLFWLVWLCFALISFWGYLLKKRANPSMLFLGTFTASTFFFIVTNLGVFLFEGLYEKTWQGLTECYIMAIPFFRNALIGDMIFSFLLFASYAVGCNLLKNPSRAKA